jgi:antitoxin YobK
VKYSDFMGVLERSRSADPMMLDFFEGWRSTDDEIARIEGYFGIVLPAGYKRFMLDIGGGGFGFLDIFPLDERPDSVEDFRSVNSDKWWTADFVAFSPVGTGDLWGFMVEAGVCEDHVAFLDHETHEVSPGDQDFFEFLAGKALKSALRSSYEQLAVHAIPRPRSTMIVMAFTLPSGPAQPPAEQLVASARITASPVLHQPAYRQARASARSAAADRAAADARKSFWLGPGSG